VIEFEPTGPPDPRNGQGAPGRGQLYINGELVGNAEFPTTVPLTFGIEGLDDGRLGDGRAGHAGRGHSGRNRAEALQLRGTNASRHARGAYNPRGRIAN